MNSHFPIREIGTAWYGRHIVIVRCQPTTNQFLGMHQSDHAPVEPPSNNCAETLARFVSIGYSIIGAYFVPPKEIHYLLFK
ncbi:hypothetical protein ACFSCX_18005 [Bacillus salitolerans]|uniref:Uncharacterized protein n=1 Tax=Bacillus salitolerans TaxID=1437434 RepID=A0ABW4LTI8_9BACI